MSDLDLSSLSEGPVGVLAPASSVMARGAQRRRRQRLASVAAVLVLALGGASVALQQGGQPDALQYGPERTPSCAPGDCIDPDEVEVVTSPTGLPTAVPASRVPEAEILQGAKVWGVYLAVSRGGIDAKVEAARAEAERAGYHPSSGEIGCDRGAAAGLGLPNEQYSAAAVYFATRELAQQFVDRWEPGVVGTVQVEVFCAD